MNHFRVRASALALAAGLLAAAPGHAQVAAEPKAPPVADAVPPTAEDVAAQAPATPADEIVVTGTSIRGVAPVGSSLVSVGRADIDNSAATTTIKLLQETPQVLNYGVSDSSRNGSGGAGNISYSNSINLRGVGPYATLTLLNGHRAITQGTLAATVDPSILPTIALERVEIIADGASAIYGSDAVAGVVNLILRRGYDGFQIDTQKGFADHYGEFQLGAIAGHKWDSGQLTVAFQHSYRTNLAGVDRDFYQSDLRPRGGADYRVPQCSPGNIVVGGVSYAIPAAGATPANLVRGTQNLCDNVKATDILPQQELNSATFTFDQDLTDGVRFFADGLFARRNGVRFSAVANQNLTVPSSNAFFVAPAGLTLPLCAASAGAPVGARCETVQYAFTNDYGATARTDLFSESWQGTAGLNVKLPSDFQFNVYGTAGRNRERVVTVGNATLTSALTTALASSNPATAFNPFGTTANSPSVIAAVFNTVTTTPAITRMKAAEGKIDGPLFALPGGDVRVAVGANYYEVKLRSGQVRGPIGMQTGTDQRLGRNVKSVYGELLIPIFGNDNAIPGFQKLDLDLAGRIDKYNDVGVTRNPKIGLNWTPIRQIKLHGSYGTSFRAPLLTQRVSASGSQLFIQNYFDPTVNGGTTVQGVAQNGGNLDLVPETARTWSGGIDFTPDFLPGAALSLNYFDLVYKGQVASFLSNLNVLRQESLYQSVILRGTAAQARIAQLVAQGLTVNGGTPAAALAANVYVDGRTNNLGTTITRGIDFQLTAPLRTETMGDFRFALRGTRYFVYKVALTPGGTIIDQINNLDYPLKLRARGSVGWNYAGFGAIAFVNYQNGFNNTLFNPAKKIRANTTLDLTMSYEFGKDYADARSGLKLGLEVVNAFDRNPPFVDVAPTNNGGGGYDPQTSSPLGRVISVSLTKTF